jgi:hypothetical protein
MEKNYKHITGLIESLRRSNHFSSPQALTASLKALLQEFSEILAYSRKKFSPEIDEAFLETIFSIYAALQNQGWTLTEFDSMFTDGKDLKISKILWDDYTTFLALTNTNDTDPDQENMFCAIYDKKLISTDWELDMGVYLPSLGVVVEEKVKITLTFILSNSEMAKQVFRVDPDLLDDILRKLKMALKAAENMEKELLTA